MEIHCSARRHGVADQDFAKAKPSGAANRGAFDYLRGVEAVNLPPYTELGWDQPAFRPIDLPVSRADAERPSADGTKAVTGVQSATRPETAGG